MTCGAAIGIICKAPRPGRSKTRLIPVLGDERAALLSGCFLRDIAATIEALPADQNARGYAVFAPVDAEAELRALMPASFGMLFHGSHVLGEVLSNAAGSLLALGHDCVLLVNSDSPTLPALFLRQAIAALRQPGDRVVFGPATDGGYYLIGLKVAHTRLFENVPWSTERVLAASLERAAEIGLEVVQLAPWYDVDDATSLADLRDELAGRRPALLPAGITGGPAEATRALLREIDTHAQADAGERRAHV